MDGFGDFCQLFCSGDIGDADVGEDDFDASGFELGFYLSDALSAPAIGTKGEASVIFRGKSLEITQEAGDGRHHLIVDGRGADGQVFAGEDVRDDIRKRSFLDVVEGTRNTARFESFGDGAGNGFGGMPHAVKDDNGPILDFTAGPFLIAGHDGGDVLTPDNAMSGGQQLDVESV